ncbi:asparagine synthase-related protein [Dyadobacter sp. CY261]|uniref:asparagine synthase-related protein n=1 Tax=Dyadobacter sp. CY261 TaxID=2907203 RepID=UPI001F388CCD|nr:asparagine synthase-related protein [Dyadobacter sp. CY261]MCF0071849.1 asparagine synthase-related protein [Dyadobacter sp. CY261]
MAFEGFFFIKSEGYNKEVISAKYRKAVFLHSGYIGIDDEPLLKNRIYSVIGSVKNNSGETEIVSNKAHNFVSSFFLKATVDTIGALAFFDERTKRLSLSRELFGLCPLYYLAVPDEFIAFSTDLRSLVTNENVRKHISIDHQRLASYATFSHDGGAIYSEDTFYKNVKSVLPGHTLELSLNGEKKNTPSFTLRPSRWSHLKTVEEFGEEFRHRFIRSVNQCINDPSLSIASHLSGGLDSSSVTSVVRFLYPERGLHTLYNNSNTIDTDENLFVDEVAKKLNTTHHEILQSEEDFSILSSHVGLGAQPSSTLVTPSFTTSLLQYAKDLGCDVVLNGSDGDSIAGSGLELIIYSFQRRDWALVKDLLRKRVKYYTHAYKYPGWNSFSEEKKYHLVLQNFLYARITSKLLYSSPAEFRNFYADVSKNFPVSYQYFLTRGIGSILNKFRKRQIRPSAHIFRKEFIAEFGLSDDNLQSMDGLMETGASAEQIQALRDVYNAQTMFSNEQSFFLSKHHGIADASPFYDSDLFELCLAVPDVMKFGDGIGRSHFRQAMKGILPEEVRCRSTKTHVGHRAQDVISRMYQQATSLLGDSNEIWHYIDPASFAHQISLLKNDKVPYTHKMNTWFHIARTISIALWLEWLNESKT